MSRYSNIPTFNTPEDPKRRYPTIKYPPIPLDPSDIYVYTNAGDRYDLLAQSFYEDSSLWWIISSANYGTNQSSLIPDTGTQIRIPSRERLYSIISEFEFLNGAL
jgi:hypothetical protein